MLAALPSSTDSSLLILPLALDGVSKTILPVFRAEKKDVYNNHYDTLSLTHQLTATQPSEVVSVVSFEREILAS